MLKLRPFLSTIQPKECLSINKGAFLALLNLSVVSLPPFLVFLGMIASDITGSGTNIEVIANRVL